MPLTLTDFYVKTDRKRDKNLRDWEIMSIFAPSESTTLPVEQRTRVELFLYVAKWSTTSNHSMPSCATSPICWTASSRRTLLLLTSRRSYRNILRLPPPQWGLSRTGRTSRCGSNIIYHRQTIGKDLARQRQAQASTLSLLTPCHLLAIPFLVPCYLYHIRTLFARYPNDILPPILRLSYAYALPMLRLPYISVRSPLHQRLISVTSKGG